MLLIYFSDHRLCFYIHDEIEFVNIFVEDFLSLILIGIMTSKQFHKITKGHGDFLSLILIGIMTSKQFHKITKGHGA